jgi:tetratricopeptide (TPR) repeat protein
MTDEVRLELLGKSTQLTEQQKQFLHKVRRLYEEFAASQDDVPQGKLDRAVGYYRVAFCQETLGEWKQAEASYKEALEIVRPLAADFPEVMDYRVVLGSCYDSLARFLRNLNRFDEAESYFKHALAVRERLAGDYPLVLDNHNRLASSHLHLGGLLVHTRRPEQAITEYHEALAIWERLAAESPKDPTYRRDVAAARGNLSIAFIRMRRLKEAEDASRECVSGFEKLAADFPDMVQYREDLANAHSVHGGLLDEMGHYPEAETAAKAAIALWRELAAAYPALPMYRQRIASSLTNLGAIYRRTNQLKAAEAVFIESLALRQQLAKDFPIVPEYQRELGDALVHLAGVKNVNGDYAEARQLLGQAQACIAAALKVYPNDPYCQHALRNLHGEMCHALLGLGQHSATVAEADALARFAVDPVGDLYDAACFVARCVPLAEKDPMLDESKRKELAAQYAGRALALLRQAVQRGYTDAAHVRKDNDLDSLRSRRDFQDLLRELDEKARTAKPMESKTGR